MLLFVTGVFFLIDVAVPGDWTSQFILTGEQRTALQQELGLDRSLWQQYAAWITGLIRLDLGLSLSGVPVWEAVRQALASTMLVLTLGLGAGFWLGSRLGRFSSWTRRRIIAGGVTMVAIVFLTAFPPALGFLLERLAENTLGRPQVSRLRRFDADLWSAATVEPDGIVWRMLATVVLVAVVTTLVAVVAGRRGRPIPWPARAGGLVIGTLAIWWLAGWQSYAFDHVGRSLLIAVALAILTTGEVVLITRAAMADSAQQDFVMAARSRGLTERSVRDRHAARAAMLPTLTRLVVGLPYLMTGLVILESALRTDGLGTLIFDALGNQDTPLVAGSLVIVGLLTVVLRIGLEITHAALDPRQRNASIGVGP